MKATALPPRTKRLHSTRMKRRNNKRAAKRRLEHFGTKAAYVRSFGCCVCGEHPSDPHHYPSRGAGGTSRDLVPLCRKHHREFDGINSGQATFQAKYSIDLKAVAEKLEAWFLESPQPLAF